MFDTRDIANLSHFVALAHTKLNTVVLAHLRLDTRVMHVLLA